MNGPSLIRYSLFALLAVILMTPATARDSGESRPAIQQAQDLLQRSRSRLVRNPERLSLLLGAARIASPGMLAGKSPDGEIYNTAVTQLVIALRNGDYADRDVAGSGGAFRLAIDRTGGHRLDPAMADIVTAAADIHLRGLEDRAAEKGVGVPFVFCFFQGSPFLRGQPGISRIGLSISVTAVLTFDGEDAHLAFYDRIDRNQIEIGGRGQTLAADFSAAIAQTVSRTPNRPFDIPGLIFTRQHLASAGLYQFQLFDPARIPVILVHGLFSRPEAWTQVLNGLMADPRIRRRYQFWFFLYPTGLPIWKSSMLLRSDLDQFHRDLERGGRQPNLHHIILVGHSMGGLISSLMVREPGESLWATFSDRSLDELELTPEAKKLVEDMVKFESREDIARVIYVTTPHRGSPIPHNPIIQQAIRLIQMPQTFNSRDREILVDAIREDLRGLFILPANSIRFLKSGSPVLEAVETLPLSDDIPYHSIIGDRGKGDSPDSSDGIVPYWSSHLESAVSETIIPTDHSAPERPETTEAIRRILLQAAGYHP